MVVSITDSVDFESKKQPVKYQGWLSPSCFKLISDKYCDLLGKMLHFQVGNIFDDMI